MSVATVETHGRARIGRTLLEAAVVIVFVLLVWNNYSLRRREARVAAATRTERGFVAREQVGIIPATSLDGTRRDLDLRATRAVVAIVDPRCDSCRELLTSVKDMPDVRVLSVAPAADSREGGMPASTHVVAQPLPGALASRFAVFPQLFVIDRGEIVRTCARVAECR